MRNLRAACGKTPMGTQDDGCVAVDTGHCCCFRESVRGAYQLSADPVKYSLCEQLGGGKGGHCVRCLHGELLSNGRLS
jgi:hypothetical protein